MNSASRPTRCCRRSLFVRKVAGAALRVMRVVLAQDLHQARRLFSEQAGHRGAD
ncbi:hypothetical protein ABT215_03690 [Streptomyces sp900105755]|uniref:hypothetical protein n=1 Tax=Streptomyces sp. 900105755 TaxID=3154389 RepID=UPI00331FFC69